MEEHQGQLAAAIANHDPVRRAAIAGLMTQHRDLHGDNATDRRCIDGHPMAAIDQPARSMPQQIGDMGSGRLGHQGSEARSDAVKRGDRSEQGIKRGRSHRITQGWRLGFVNSTKIFFGGGIETVKAASY
jgi:hypothetical protein